MVTIVAIVFIVISNLHKVFLESHDKSLLMEGISTRGSGLSLLSPPSEP